MASTSAQAAMPPTLPNQDLGSIIKSPFDHPDLDPRTLVELNLIALSGSIRDKKEWTRKIKDPGIMSKWRAEASSQNADPAALEYIFAEQQHLARLYPENLYPSAVPGVFAADDWIPEDVQVALLEGVKALEVEGEPDWHPGSDDQVRDLVHPSMYPLVYDVSTQIPEGAAALTLDNCLQAIGSGTAVIELPPHIGLPDAKCSQRFQWLPAEFDVQADGQVRILSCINNLHPQKHAALYPVIASVFQRFVPLFNKVLTACANLWEPVISPSYDWYSHLNSPKERDFENDALYYEAYDDWLENREPQQPDIPTYQPQDPQQHVVDLNGRRLQVIVKLAAIHLTPKKPEFPGGSWHLEGMHNENILATGIYYFDQHNVQPSSIAFRYSVADEDLEYEQNDRSGVAKIYGLEDEGPNNQPLGSVTTLPDRCLCFPNSLQHRVQPFKLQDASQPGHRKILVFWLVHPATRIMSTERVPPQQLEWFKDVLFNDPKFWPSALPAMPQKMVQECLDEVSTCPYSMKKAREYREQLMDERKFYVKHQNEEVFERGVYLCEH